MSLRLWGRRAHRWGSALIAGPLLLVIGTGLLLQVKKDWAWVQPATTRGSTKTPPAEAGLDRLLEAARGAEGISWGGWEDVDRLDVRPDRGIAKILGRDRMEAQVDLATLEVLQVAYRRSDLIESLHDGSWFGDAAKLWVFLPSAGVTLALWVTGIYLFMLPYASKRAKAARMKARREGTWKEEGA